MYTHSGGEAIMQIATAAKASKALPLEGSCSHHTAKCPAWKGCGCPAEKCCQQLCQPAPGTSCGIPGGMLWQSSPRAMERVDHLGWTGHHGGSLFPELFLEGVLYPFK